MSSPAGLISQLPKHLLHKTVSFVHAFDLPSLALTTPTLAQVGRDGAMDEAKLLWGDSPVPAFAIGDARQAWPRVIESVLTPGRSSHRTERSDFPPAEVLHRVRACVRAKAKVSVVATMLVRCGCPPDKKMQIAWSLAQEHLVPHYWAAREMRKGELRDAACWDVAEALPLEADVLLEALVTAVAARRVYWLDEEGFKESYGGGVMPETIQCVLPFAKGEIGLLSNCFPEAFRRVANVNYPPSYSHGPRRAKITDASHLAIRDDPGIASKLMGRLGTLRHHNFEAYNSISHDRGVCFSNPS